METSTYMIMLWNFFIKNNIDFTQEQKILLLCHNEQTINFLKQILWKEFEHMSIEIFCLNMHSSLQQIYKYKR
jgi:hypothetical protein